MNNSLAITQRNTSGYCYMCLFELGLSVFDDSKNIIFSQKFDNPVSFYRMIKIGDFPKELNIVFEKLKGYEKILINDLNLDFHLRNAGCRTELLDEKKIFEIQREKLDILVASGFAKNILNATLELRKFAIELSTSKIRETSEKLDLHIIQAINLLDELDKIINLMGTRMREWYGLHFPELDNLVQSITTYADIIIHAGNRENINYELLNSLGFTEKKIEVIVDASKRSKGGLITTENQTILKKLAEQVKTQNELRRITSEHIDTFMEIIAPNVTALLTSSIGARIIARAGSLTRLASMSASTIQVLGAEKALFRALKTGARPPKHGLIFQHAMVHSAPKWQRGKIARVLAAKVAIAARIDVYRHEGKDESLSTKLMDRVAEIQEKYKEPQVKEAPRFNKPQRTHKKDMPRNRFKSKGRDKRKFGKRR